MSAKSKAVRRDEKQKSSPYTKIIIGSLVSVALYFILIALIAAMALKSDLSPSAYMPAGIISGILSSLIGGFVSVRPIKEKGVLFGALTGVVQAIICSLVLFVVNGNAAGNGIFILSAVMILCSAVGGIAAVNLKIKKKY